VQHRVDIRCAVADIDGSLTWHAELGAQSVQRRDLAVAGCHLLNGVDLAVRVVAEARPENA
jgi:hypothetical protein